MSPAPWIFLPVRVFLHTQAMWYVACQSPRGDTGSPTRPYPPSSTSPLRLNIHRLVKWLSPSNNALCCNSLFLHMQLKETNYCAPVTCHYGLRRDCLAPLYKYNTCIPIQNLFTCKAMDQNEYPVSAEYIQGDYDGESTVPCSQTYHTLIEQRESIVRTFPSFRATKK